MRFARQSFSAVHQCWQCAQAEQVVRLYAPGQARAFVTAHRLPAQVQVRRLQGVLASGEVQVLGTSLLERHAYPSEEFKTVYGWRWGEETYCDRLKNLFEPERFSGTSVTAIEQDFYGVGFLATLERVLSKPAPAAFSARTPTPALPPTEAMEAKGSPVVQVNRAMSYVALVERVGVLVSQPGRSPAAVLAELQHWLQTSPTRVRPGRQYPRPKLTHAQRLRFQRYVKRLIA
jgi:hypothetical protein